MSSNILCKITREIVINLKKKNGVYSLHIKRVTIQKYSLSTRIPLTMISEVQINLYSLFYLETLFPVETSRNLKSLLRNSVSDVL